MTVRIRRFGAVIALVCAGVHAHTCVHASLYAHVRAGRMCVRIDRVRVMSTCVRACGVRMCACVYVCLWFLCVYE